MREEKLLPEGWAPDSEGQTTVRPVGLPMGFKLSPVIFTKLMRVLTKRWRERGIRLVHYLDDLLFCAETVEEAERIRDMVLRDLQHLGLAPSWRKTMAKPSTRVKFLGFIVDSEQMRIYVTGERLDKLEEAAKVLVKRAEGCEKAAMRELASVAGKIVSMAPAIPAARMLTRACYSLVRPGERDWDDEVELTEEVREELMEVVTSLRVWNRKGAPIRRTLGAKQVRLITDASEHGYGFRVDGQQRQWELSRESRAAARDWDEGDEVQHQVWRELLALEKCIQEIGSDVLAGRTVLVCTDAKVTLRYINWGAGSSKVMSAIMRRIFDRCLELEISLMAEHVSGESMKATAVDSLSRWGEFVVRQKVFETFNKDAEWGGARGYTCDLYASAKTAKVARFGARGEPSAADGGIEGCVGDARVAEFEAHENLWVCPPLQVIRQAVEGVLQKGVRSTVVVPDWENQPWHVFLRQEATRSKLLPWSSRWPTMCDAASKKTTAHHADKWRFRAFLLEPARKAVDTATEAAPRREQQLWGKQMKLREGEGWVSGVDLGRVRQRRRWKVLDLCSGMGTVPWVLDKLGVDALVWECEIDPKGRAVAAARAPMAEQLTPHTIWYWASAEGLKRLKKMRPHMVVAGFPCQGVSCANKFGTGLRGKSSVFEAVQAIINFLRDEGVDCDFLVECVDFKDKYPEEFAYVCRRLGVRAVTLRAERVSACFRRRAYWASFEIPGLEWRGVDPNSVLDAGRWTWWPHLPTIVASGTRSWNCREVVQDERGEVGPLRVWEMEKAMGFDAGFTAVQGLTVEDRHRLVGNAFHAEVMRHLALAAVAAQALRGDVFELRDAAEDVTQQAMKKARGADGYITRDDVRNKTVNERARKGDGPESMWERARKKATSPKKFEGGLGWQGDAGWAARARAFMQRTAAKAEVSGRNRGEREGLSSRERDQAKMDTLGSSGSGEAVVSIHGLGSRSPRQWREEAREVMKRVRVGVTRSGETEEMPKRRRVKMKEEVGAGGGKQTTQRTSKREAVWKQMLQGVTGEGALEKRPTNMWELTRARRKEGEVVPQLKHLGWERRRPEEWSRQPKELSLLAVFGQGLANDFAMKALSEATWRQYSAWYGVFEAFCELFKVGLGECDDHTVRVEMLRVAVALMAGSYAMGTLEIFVSAVSERFRQREWGSPHADGLFKRTWEGIKRELGTQKKKKPPLEARHVEGLLSIEGTPEGWSEMQWSQGKVIMMMGWQLYNRRQDFARMQPCDLRFRRDEVLGPVLEVLIRYAKNDKYGRTRAPKLAECAEDDTVCPIRLMKEYMAVTGIAICAGCDKEWGKPYACTVCPPLFPTILGDTRGGMQERAMPDSRVSMVLKRMMVTLARVRPDLLTMEEARAFSAKSLRCGGTSESAAQQVRDGVKQGHGGWLSRESLRHYDLMTKGEETAVSKALSAAVARLKAGRPPRQEREGEEGDERRELDANDRVARLEDEGGQSTGSDEGEEREYTVLRVVDARQARGALEYKVLWAPTESGGRSEDTWEPADRLMEDGQGHKIGGFWRGKVGKQRKREGLRS